MSKKATEFQRKAMSWMYRGKEIFKPCLLYTSVVPDDQRREQLAFLEDVFFKLLVLIVRQRRDLILELPEGFSYLYGQLAGRRQNECFDTFAIIRFI